MNPTVTIHSEADGVTQTITLTKTRADTGYFTRISKMSVLVFVELAPRRRDAKYVRFL